MPKIKKKELRALSSEEFGSKLAELRKELMKSRTEVSTGIAIKNPGQIKQAKKTIAKITTILKEREREAKQKE